MNAANNITISINANYSIVHICYMRDTCDQWVDSWCGSMKDIIVCVFVEVLEYHYFTPIMK